MLIHRRPRRPKKRPGYIRAARALPRNHIKNALLAVNCNFSPLARGKRLRFSATIAQAARGRSIYFSMYLLPIRARFACDFSVIVHRLKNVLNNLHYVVTSVFGVVSRQKA